MDELLAAAEGMRKIEMTQNIRELKEFKEELMRKEVEDESLTGFMTAVDLKRERLRKKDEGVFKVPAVPLKRLVPAKTFRGKELSTSATSGLDLSKDPAEASNGPACHFPLGDPMPIPGTEGFMIQRYLVTPKQCHAAKAESKRYYYPSLELQWKAQEEVLEHRDKESERSRKCKASRERRVQKLYKYVQDNTNDSIEKLEGKLLSPTLYNDLARLLDWQPIDMKKVEEDEKEANASGKYA